MTSQIIELPVANGGNVWSPFDKKSKFSKRPRKTGFFIALSAFIVASAYVVLALTTDLLYRRPPVIKGEKLVFTNYDPLPENIFTICVGIIVISLPLILLYFKFNTIVFLVLTFILGISGVVLVFVSSNEFDYEGFKIYSEWAELDEVNIYPDAYDTLTEELKDGSYVFVERVETDNGFTLTHKHLIEKSDSK